MGILARGGRHDCQTRRRFIGSLALAGAAGFVRAPTCGPRRRPRNDDGAAAGSAEHLRLPRIRRRGVAARRGLYRYSLCALADGTNTTGPDRARRDRFRAELCFGAGRRDRSRRRDETLAGVHVGCFELFAHESVHSLAELGDKSVGVPALGSPDVFLSVMAAQVGLDPVRNPLGYTRGPAAEALLPTGKIDAFLGFPPEPQESARPAHRPRDRQQLGRPPVVAVFLLHAGGQRDYVRKYPVATKRVLRAILKAADVCAAEPARAAQRLVDGGFTDRYDYAVETLREVPYDKWREYDAEDTVRFYALRLHEVGLIKSSPQKIIADGTDWRFLERAQTRAEGMSAKEGGFEMHRSQTRRRFLTALSLAGAAGLLRHATGVAAEGRSKPPHCG